MKILFYINSLHYGGAQRVIVNLSKQFACHNNDVTIVTSFIDKKWEYKIDERVHRVSLYENEIQGGLKRNIKLIFKLRKVIKNGKYDVVIAFMAEPNIRLLLSTIFLRVKKIISIRNDPNKEYASFTFRLLAKTLFQLADGIVFQTTQAKNWFPKSIQKKSTIIYNQVDESFYIQNFDRNNPKDIVTVGRLTEQKNHKLLIDAYSILKNRISDNLIIYGEGELKEILQKYIEEKGLQDRILLAGQVNDVKEKIENAKLFVLSSDYEGLPNALMEAMALGIPCISTDCPCGGPKELLDSADYLAQNNPNDLASKMFFLLSDGKSLSVASKKMISKSALFSPDEIFKRWNEFIYGKKS